MGKAYDELSSRLPTNAEGWNEQMRRKEMWRINEAYLDGEMAQNKPIIFTSDLKDAPDWTFSYWEYEHLLANGYAERQVGDIVILEKK